MLGFLYKFNTITTGLSVITREITDALGQLGSPWHFLLLVWTAFFGLTELARDGYKGQLGLTAAGAFAIASFYLAIFQYISPRLRALRTVDVKFMKALARLFIHLSLPVILIHYVWFPLHRGLGCVMAQYWTNVKQEDWCPMISVAMAMLFSLFVIARQSYAGRRKTYSVYKAIWSPSPIKTYTPRKRNYSGVVTRRMSVERALR